MSEEWKERLPENIRALGIVANVKTEEDFYKTIENLDSYRGASIRIPSSDASPEAMAEFQEKLKARVPGLMEVPLDNDDAGHAVALEKLGKPSKVDEYVLDAVEGYTPNETEVAYLRDLAASSDMTKRQFKKMSKKYLESSAAKRAEMEVALNVERDSVKKEWGMAVEEKYSALTEFAKSSGAPASLVRALENRTATLPELKWLESLQSAGKETSTVASQQQSGVRVDGKLTPYEAETSIQDLMASEAYQRGDAKAVKRMLELVEMAGG